MVFKQWWRQFLCFIFFFLGLVPNFSFAEDPAPYNQIIYQGYLANEEWVQNPVYIVWQLWQPENSIEGYPQFTVQKISYPGLDPLVVRLMVKRAGLLDDSVNSEQRFVDFKKIEGVWQIIAIQLNYECQPGHFSYEAGGLCS